MTHLLLVLALLQPPAVRCVALAPHFEGEPTDGQLAEMINEIKALGANLLLMVVQWGQQDVEAVAIRPYRWGTNDRQVKTALAHARAQGLDTLVFPIVHLAELGPGRWRGTLAPRDRAAWWASYTHFILHYAQLAAETQAGWFSVGSELGRQEAEEAHWRGLIAAVRGVFPGRLTYSANWDHFTHVGFWDALDVVGMNAYHPIATREGASLAELTAGWTAVRSSLLLWHGFLGRPLLFTEVGYPSVVGGARRPYDFGGTAPADPEEQARAWGAFAAVWRDQPQVAGGCVWLWTGRGGPADTGYMPRGKPAEGIIRGWFRGE